MSEPRYVTLVQSTDDGIFGYVLDTWDCYRECARFRGSRATARRQAETVAARWNAEHDEWMAA